ncbi:MAG: 30S ribosome-binding factor RbfA [Bacteroidetes bacterium]|nr:30S ribosome-binding factor RbfA [Bacteroidota bacterium]MBS1539085.1 30S ribosome-binding factor RbfA [Bacteroidota bacterium]
MTLRQQKYGRLIQKELSDVFLKRKSDFLGNAFVTLAEVRMSPDLSVAKVYISMMLAKDKKVVMGNLNLHKNEIRKELGLRIRHQARIVPELVFVLDEVEENAQRMDELLKNLNIPKE